MSLNSLQPVVTHPSTLHLYLFTLMIGTWSQFFLQQRLSIDPLFQRTFHHGVTFYSS